MSDLHWAVHALRDIQSAIDSDRYDVAAFHIEDAIAAILARDDQDGQGVVDMTAMRDKMVGD